MCGNGHFMAIMSDNRGRLSYNLHTDGGGFHIQLLFFLLQDAGSLPFFSHFLFLIPIENKQKIRTIRAVKVG